MVLNYIVGIGLWLVVLGVGLVLTVPDVPVLPLTLVSVAVLVLVPLAFYPRSKTTWAAVEYLVLRADPDYHAPGASRPTREGPGVTEAAIGLMTALGLSTATGLNAYLPLLILGGLARWTDLITLDAPYDTLAEPGVMLAIGVIAIVDFVGDKVPALDSVLHAIGLVVAPVAGALVALAATGNDAVDPAFAVVVGVAAAGATHGARSIVRPASTAFTGGAGNPVLSLGEDTVSTVLAFSAVIVPVVAFLMVVALAWLLVWGVRRAWRSRSATRRVDDRPRA